MPMILAPVRPAPSRRPAVHPHEGAVPSTLNAQREARAPRPEVGMQAQVSILHHDYPARAREQVEQKLQHLVKFYDRIVSMRALLERQHEEHRVEIVAHVARGAVLVVDARSTAFSTALEEAIQRMERLLKKQNDKRTSGRRRGRTGG
jgi:ribosomal subunit interface protein